ncbi:MAG: F0F1 ATP synthase subunit B family protein [Acidobacteriaceae bacterium]
MILSPARLRLRVLQLPGLHAFVLAFCGLFLLSFAAPRAHAAFAGSTAQSAAPAQGSTTTAQVEHRSQRNEEIQRKKIDDPEAEDGVNVYRHSPMVQTLARMFGLSVEATSRSFEILNFLIVMGFIVWFLARLLPKTLRGRTQRIQNQLQQARTVTEDANRRLAGVEERLARLDTEIDAIKTQAQQETLAREGQLRAALEQEKQSILDSSVQEIEAASGKALNQLRRLTAELAIERAKHKIAVTVEADRSLVESFLVDLDRERRSGGVN